MHISLNFTFYKYFFCYWSTLMWKWHQKINTALCNLRPLFPFKGMQWNGQFWAQILRKNQWNQTSAVCFREIPLNIMPEFPVSSHVAAQSSRHEPYECKLIVWITLIICALVLLTKKKSLRDYFLKIIKHFLYQYTWHCHNVSESLCTVNNNIN